MNNKIDNYVNTLFNDIPKTKKAIELKEEIISNMNDRYLDYISDGLSKSEAYKLTIANFGDFDEMLSELMPTEDFKAKVDSYRRRNAINISIAIMLYILSPVVLFAVNMFDIENMPYAVFGVAALLVVVAIATGILIFTDLSTPYDIKQFIDDGNSKEYKHLSEGQKLIASIYWSIVTCLYLFISFSTDAWHITWIIWIFAGTLNSIAIYLVKKDKKTV